MAERKFNVGDELRIREWEDMKSEFGIDSSDEIQCDGCFTQRMKYMCGSDFTVKGVFGIRYSSKEGIEYTKNNGTDYWVITADMLEYRKTREFTPATDDEIRMLFA